MLHSHLSKCNTRYKVVAYRKLAKGKLGENKEEEEEEEEEEAKEAKEAKEVKETKQLKAEKRGKEQASLMKYFRPPEVSSCGRKN